MAVILRPIDFAGEAREPAQGKREIERLRLRRSLSSAFRLDRFEDGLVNARRRELDSVAGYRNAPDSPDSLDSLDRTPGTTLYTSGIAVEPVGR